MLVCNRLANLYKEFNFYKKIKILLIYFFKKLNYTYITLIIFENFRNKLGKYFIINI